MVILVFEQQGFWFVFGFTVTGFTRRFTRVGKRLLGATEITKGFFLVDAPVLAERANGFRELAADTIHVDMRKNLQL